MFSDRKIKVEWEPAVSSSGEKAAQKESQRRRALGEIVRMILVTAVFGFAAGRLLGGLWELVPPFFSGTVRKSLYALLPMIVIAQGLGNYFPRYRLRLGLGGLILYGGFFYFFLRKNAEALVYGAEPYIRKYLTFFNSYFKTGYSFDLQPAEQIGRMPPAEALTGLFFILLVIIGTLACFCGSRYMQAIPAMLALLLVLFVGKKPDVTGMALLFAGNVFSAGKGWEHPDASRCMPVSGNKRAAGRTQLFRWCLMIALAAGIPLLCRTALRPAVEKLAQKGEQVKNFQKEWEARADNYLALYYRGGYEEVSNRKPEYQEKEMLQMTVDTGKDGKSSPNGAFSKENMEYLRGFYGIYYNRGRWTSGYDNFTQACQEQGKDEKRLSWLLAQTAGTGISAIHKEDIPWGSTYERVWNNILYTGSTSRVVFQPYGMIFGKEDGRSYLGEARLERESGQKNFISCSWKSSSGKLGRIWRQAWKELLWMEPDFGKKKSKMPDGDSFLWLLLSQQEATAKTRQDWELFQWYNQYVKEQYLSVPEEVLGTIDSVVRQVRDRIDFFEWMGEEDQFSEREVSLYHEGGAGLYPIKPAGVLNAGRIECARAVRRLLSRYPYSLDLDPLPQGEDPVVYFFRKGKKGYCVHFASAGVLILRRMGVPARFASGYGIRKNQFVKTGEEKWTASVLDSNAHAWAEIYLDNIGWVPVDMTPGSDAETDEVRETENSGSEQETEKAETQEETETPQKEEKPVQTEKKTGEENSEKKSIGSGNDGKSEKDSRNGIVPVTGGLLFLILAAAGVYVWIRRRRDDSRWENRLHRRHYRVRVLQINRRICAKLCRKIHRNANTIRDPEYGRLLKEQYPQISPEEWDRYMSVVMRAGFSDAQILEEEAVFCQEIWERIGQ